MNDIDVLRSLAPEAPAPDHEARERMLAPLLARIEAEPAHTRGSRSRRGAITVVLVAAVLSVGALAAAAVTHLWTEGHPVAIDIPPDNKHGEEVTLGIPDGNGGIGSAAQFEAAVQEFAPAIRLPEGHDFSAWTSHIESVTDFAGGDVAWRRIDVATGMVFVAQCQWGQQWLGASDTSDAQAMRQSSTVLGEIGTWTRDSGIDGGSLAELVSQMRAGRVDELRQFLGVNCAGTGSITGSKTKLDGIAQDELLRGLDAAQRYFADHGTYSGFDIDAAEALLPSLTWTSPDASPPAGPGQTDIVIAGEERLVLSEESESGEIFCVDAEAGDVRRGTTDRASVDTGTAACSPGGW